MILKATHDEWQFYLSMHLHLGRRPLFVLKCICDSSTIGLALRATSHMRLSAHDHDTSSTLIGGKGGAGPSSLHTTLEGPTE